MRKFILWVLLIGSVLMFGCQSKQSEHLEIPAVYTNLTVDELKEKVTIPIKLPTKLPFEPVEIVADLEDYSQLYENEHVEEVKIYYLKDNRQYRYLELTISNLEQKPSEDENVTLSDGTVASYSQDEIGQLLFWQVDDLYYRLVYFTSPDINEGQDPLSIDQFIEIADSFQAM